MEELRHHGYKVGPGTLYPLLRGLETSGLLTVTEDVVSGKRRKNFRITPSGKRLLTEARSKLKELASEIIDDKDARQSRESKSKEG